MITETFPSIVPNIKELVLCKYPYEGWFPYDVQAEAGEKNKEQMKTLWNVLMIVRSDSSKFILTTSL